MKKWLGVRNRFKPLPFPANKKDTDERCLFYCERAVKRCVNVGKNSEKVCDYELFRKSMLNFQASKCQGNYIKVKTEIPRLVRPNREPPLTTILR